MKQHYVCIFLNQSVIQEWCKEGDARPLKMKPGSCHRRQFMLTVFWNYEGVVLLDFLEKGSNLTGEYYKQLYVNSLQILLQRGMVNRWFLQDNAPIHTSDVVQQVIRDSGIELLPHPPYSPDLAPSDFHFFVY